MNVSLNLPSLYVKPLNNNLYENLTYIPFVSITKGAFDILLSVSALIASVAMDIFVTLDILNLVLKNDPENNRGLIARINHTLELKNSIREAGAIGLTDGILELIPFFGNLALGFLHGRIQIIPNQNR